jgi:DNA-binding SARP family transcriptional activator/TolB-like protein
MLRLQAFGGATLLTDGVPLEGAAAQRRRLALLAVVAVAGRRGISRDKLGALLWPESDQERARHSLSQWLFTTRRDLKVEDLFLGTTELRLNPDRITSDVGEFQEAVAAGAVDQAAALYAGPFLDGFHLSGAAEFERWVDGERARLAHDHHHALESLAEQRAAAGDRRGAVEAWRRLAASDPYNARFALGLMRALAASGDAAGAVAHARVHATLLREELGAEVQPDVARYAEELRTAPPAPVIPPAVTPPPVMPLVDSRPPDPVLESAHSQVPVAVRLEPAVPRPRPPARRRRWRGALLVAASVLLAIFAGAWTFVPEDQVAQLWDLFVREDTEIEGQRIVVAPLENLTGDTALTNFGRIASAWITTELGRTRRFDVVDPQTSQLTSRVVAGIPRVFRANDADVALAEEVGAGLLISGQYYLEGDSIRVQVRMTDVESGRVLSTPGAPVSGVRRGEHALVQQLAERVVGMAASVVDRSSAGSGIAGGTLPHSYQAFEEAKLAWDSYYAGDVSGIFRHARRATEIDSAYMMPLAIQAQVHADARNWAQVDSLARTMEAHRAGLSPLEVAVVDMLAAAVRGDLPNQLRGAIRVAEAAPASAETRTHAARLAVNANQPVLALQQLDAISPYRGVMLRVPWYWNWTAAAYHLMGEHDAELRAARKGIRRFPDVHTAVGTLGRALAAQGKGSDVRELIDRLPGAGTPDGARRWKIALDWSRELRAHGHEADARRLLDDLHAQLAQVPATPAAARFRARVLGERGQHAAAYAAWHRLHAEDSTSLELRGSLGVAAARAGDTATARAMDAAILAAGERYAHGRDAMWRARIAATLGEADRAVLLVGEAVGAGYPRFFDPSGGPYDEPELHADPALLPLRAHPAFRTLLAPRG